MCYKIDLIWYFKCARSLFANYLYNLNLIIQCNFQFDELANFIEETSTIGDVIVMVVRGVSTLYTASDESKVKTTLRKIGLGSFAGCIDESYTGITCSIIPILSI